MLYSDSLREMMQNAVNESFWDGLGVEIGPCAIFKDFPEFQKNMENQESWKKSHNRKIIWNWMLWATKRRLLKLPFGGVPPHQKAGNTRGDHVMGPAKACIPPGGYPPQRLLHYFLEQT